MELALIWYFVGVVSFIYWWTSEHDFTTAEVFLAGMAGVCGPLAFLIGYFVHGNSPKFILKRKRA